MISQVTQDEIAAFFTALSDQDVEQAKRLLDRRPELVNLPGPEGGQGFPSELPLAALFNIKDLPDSQGNSGLLWVRGNAEMVRLLLRYAPDFEGAYQREPLMAQAILFLPETVKDFLDAGLAAHQSLPDGRQVGFFQQIAESESPDAAQAILALHAHGVDFNAPDDHGRFALHTLLALFHGPANTLPWDPPFNALAENKLAKLEALLACGVNPNQKDAEGSTPLDKLFESADSSECRKQAAELLIRHGADIQHPLALSHMLPMDKLFQQKLASSGHTTYLASLCRMIDHARGRRR